MVAWGIPDFYLADEDATFIADNLDIPFTTEEMNRYIRTHHTEHPDFAKKIPTSFIRLVEYDRTQAAESSPLSRRSLGEGGFDTRPILLPSIPFDPQTAYTRLCDTLLSQLDIYRSQAEP